MAHAVTIVDIRSLSYTGTTWINLLLGSHERGFALGPPDRVLRLLEDPARVDDADHRSAQAEDACRVHAGECTFWPRFFAEYDRAGNFFVQLAAAADRDFIVLNNPEGAGPAARHLADPRVATRRIHVVRDGRAVCNSYRGYYPDKSFREIVEEWFHPSASVFPFRADDRDTLNVRYEDVVADQRGFLARAEAFLGVRYPDNVTRFWEFDHHTTAGNGGTIGIVKRFGGKPFRKRDRAFQEERYEKLLADPERPVIDTRWEDALDRDDRLLFDRVCGAYHEAWGYSRDRFEPVGLAERTSR